MIERQVRLRGGRTTAGVSRIGKTVRRPLGPHSAWVHRLLRHLEARGFAGAPRFLGIDASGREILSFLPGHVPDELGEFSPVQLGAGARLLRDLHDATIGAELSGYRQVVCHGDASPCNCVFVGGVPAAFIDFDAAHPGDRREDVGYAAWLWLDIGNADLAPDAQGRRLADFFVAYGAIDMADALPAVLDAQVELFDRRGSSAETRRWAQKCRGWVERNLGDLTRALYARATRVGAAVRPSNAPRQTRPRTPRRRR